MKGSAKWQNTLIFLTLGLLTLVLGWVVLTGTRQTVRLSRELALVSTFQLQAKELQLLASRLPLDPAGHDLAQAIATGQTLTRAMEAMAERGRPLGQGPPTPTLSNQLESLRQAFLDLTALYDDEVTRGQTQQALLDLVEQRLAALAPEPRAQLKPRLAAFRQLLSRFQQEERGDHPLVPMQDLLAEIKGLTSEPTIIETLNRLQHEYEGQGAREAALQGRKQHLERLAAAFCRATQSTSDEIVRRGNRDLERRHGLTLALCTALAGAIILAFLLSQHTIATGQRALRQGVSVIRSALPAPRTPATGHADDPEVARHCLLAAAATIQESGEELSASRALFSGLAATIQDWVWMVDRDGICTYSHQPSAWRPLGPDDQKGVGQPLAKLLAGADHTSLAPLLQAAMSEQTPFDQVAEEWSLAHGGTKPVATSGRPILDSGGQFQGYILISRDLSSQRRTELELAKASHAITFLNQVLELGLLDIKIPELQGRFLKLLTDCTWLGAQAGAAFFMIDRAKNSLVMTAHRGLDLDIPRLCGVFPLDTCLCGRAAQTGQVLFADSGDDRHEVRYPGMAVHGHYCLPVHTVAGEIIGVVVLYLNPDCQRESLDETILTSATTLIGSIIRRRQAEDRLKELNQELERRIDSRTAQLTAANQELDAFAYSVSHDLRAPLRAVDGFSQALVEDYGSGLPQEAQAYLERIRAGCSRMGSLIDDLLRLSRLTRSALNWHSVDLSQIATEISKEIGAESPQRMVEWRITPHLTAEADPTMLRAVLNNLLGNAWKYSAKTPEAKIEFGRTGDPEAAFFVRDNGAGFDMRYSDKLFKAFQRLHTSAEFPGNGIGLVTAQRIIHRHGGKIWAHGQVDQGATFYFTLGRPEPLG